ncbi:hypothetical protein ABB173_02820 [Acinetobacter baumannii]|uniref:hypothetical protein n=1 Tax=Acinetobacter baumannii TaxID=470 RepID=UPI0032EF7BCE
MSEQDLEQQDELHDDENLDIETPDDDEDRDDPETSGGENNQDDEDEGEFDIVLKGEIPEKQEEDDFHGQPAPEWLKKERAAIKEIRKQERARERRIKELEAQLDEFKKPEAIEIGEKPKLEDFGYDEENPEYIEALEKWVDRKLQLKEQERKKQEEQEKVQKIWEQKLATYEAKKAKLKINVPEFDEAEENVRDALNSMQQAMIIDGADNPDLLIYHLGTNLKKLQELAAITSPSQFAFKAAKLDAQIEKVPRKPRTSPERKPSGSAPLSGTTDTTLARLRAEAERTGDYTEVNKYKRKLKQNQ